jgi:hypothetical protein
VHAAATDALLGKLDGSGSDDEWNAIAQLRKLHEFPDLLVAKYRESKHYGARATCVYHCLRYATTNEAAFQLGLEACRDRSMVVRYRAAMLLAVAQRPDALPSLRSMMAKFPTSSADAQAAISAIVRRNANLYVDRENSGMVSLTIR